MKRIEVAKLSQLAVAHCLSNRGSLRRLTNAFQFSLGERFLWWPNGEPPQATVGIVSSRLGRNLETQHEWFCGLRSVCAGCTATEERLVFQRATFVGPYVARAAELFGAKTLQIELPRQQERFDEWEKRMLTIDPHQNSTQADREQVYVSPQVGTTDQDAPLTHLPLQDAVVFSLSQRLCAIHVRPGGNVHRALLVRLERESSPSCSLQVHLNDRLLKSKLRDQLLNAGAVGWSAIGMDPLSSPNAPCPASTGVEHCLSIPVEVDAFADYITHCTRRQNGPWPNQSVVGYLDDLILERPEANHSALSSLCRIVDRQELIAGSTAIRGGTPVVSFTEISPPELERLRVFRSHRGRWDFQPYGICIRKCWLSQRGSRPVQYGDDATWQTLAPQDRPFFQKAVSRTKAGKTIDWTVEKEWRHEGNIDLSLMSNADAIVFVPTPEEARLLTAISRWPIRYVSSK